MDARRIQAVQAYNPAQQYADLGALTQAQTPALKEIAGRLQKLSYRDMIALVDALEAAVGGDLILTADHVLSAAEKLTQ